MATKVSNHSYYGVDEFQSDFVLMCKNAMAYNAPETVYHCSAKAILEDGLAMIERVSSNSSPFLTCTHTHTHTHTHIH